MELGDMKPILEGLLFAAGDEGLDLKQMAEVLEADPRTVREALEQLADDFARQNRGIQIVELAGTYQMTTRPEHAPYFQRLAQSPARASLSQAALETLAIIAYKQPITRVEIEQIRGVKSDRALQTLLAKELVREVGRAEALGRPILYGTTKRFLDCFGLSDLSDLPDASLLEGAADLPAETRLFMERLGEKQLTIEDVAPE